MKKTIPAIALSLILLFAGISGLLSALAEDEFEDFSDFDSDMETEYFDDWDEDELFDEEAEYRAAAEYSRTTDNINAASGYSDGGLLFEGDYGYFVSEDRTFCTTALYIGQDTDVEIPSRLGGLPVAVIGDHTFSNNGLIESVTVPDGVQQIGKQAFFKCSGLRSVYLPEGVTGIGDQCFGGCALLDEISVPQSLETVGEMAFLGCFTLREITFGIGLKTIGPDAFTACYELGRVTVPSENVTIEENAFAQCPEELELIFADRI